MRTNPVACLVEGGTYTFAELEKLVGTELADRARRLARVANARVRAPRHRVPGRVPARASMYRLGDRLS